MRAAILITLMGGLGSLTRYGIQLAAERIHHALPFQPPSVGLLSGYLAANVLGCFIMGWLHSLAAARMDWPVEVRLAMTVGFLGGLTTFSTFASDTRLMLEQRLWSAAIANIFLNNGLSILAVFAGIAVGGHRPLNP